MKKITNYFIVMLYAGIVLSILPTVFKGKLPINLGMDLSGGVIVSYRPDFSKVGRAYAGKSESELMKIAKDIITDRLQRKLNTSPDVFINSKNNLIVNIPSVQNYDQVLDIVGKTYRLSFRLVLNEFEDSTGRDDLFLYEGTYLELDKPSFTGDMIDLKSIGVNPPSPETRGYSVSFKFKSPHNKKFEVYTKNNIGNSLAIMLDNDVELAPQINGAIINDGSITGDYTFDEAKDLSILLQSGSLPISLQVESLSEIGPSLGEAIKKKGTTAVLLSICLFIVFIVVAYSGRVWLLINGVFSLLFLGIMMLALMAAFQVTLDFYAIAGLILSIGISMDAFIIIFENFETSLKNFSPQNIFKYNNVIVSETYSFRKEGRILFHSIVSTFIVVVLVMYADRVKYFAVSMVAGSIASILTILFTRKTLLLTKSFAPYHGVSVLDLIRDKKFGIFRFRKFYLWLTFLAIAISFFFIFASVLKIKPFIQLGTDFQPGTQLIVDCKKGDVNSIDKFSKSLKDSFPDINVIAQEIKVESNVSSRFLLTINKPIEMIDTTNRNITKIEEEGKNSESPGFSSFGDTTSTEKNETVENPKPQTLKKVVTRQLIQHLISGSTLKILSINSIDSKLSANRFFSSMSIFVLSFLLIGIYLFLFQKPIDQLFLRGSNLEDKTHSHYWASWGIFLALIHDFSFMIIACYLFNISIDLTIVAAIISVIGYSVNDSIVLWAHIQNIANKNKDMIDPIEIVSTSIDSILSRSILTSIATMIPIFSIFILGIQELIPFATIVLIGTFFGALSSIYIVGVYAMKTLQPKKVRSYSGYSQAGNDGNDGDDDSYLSQREIMDKL